MRKRTLPRKLVLATALFILSCQVLSHIQAQHDHSHLSLPDNFCKVAPSPEPRDVVQPDGSTISVRIFGGKPAFYLETLDGYTILKDPSDGYFKYAVRGGQGDLFISNIRVTQIGERAGSEKLITSQLPRHLRYSGKTLFLKTQAFLGPITNAAGSPSYVFPSTGTRKALLLLIDFPDQAASYPLANFNNLANQEGYSVNGQSGSFRDYYRDISYNNLVINTDVSGWYRAKNNKATYGEGAGGTVATNLVREAVDAAEANGVDFSQYDGDNDGKVDVVMVIHSGRGAEESGDNDDVWSHRWVLAAGSNHITYDGKLINDYIIQAEKYGPTNITNIGVLCHEFGHALGLPDLYDTDGSSSGLGTWCCMAGGTWNNSGKTPAQMSLWCKEQLGWINPAILTGSGQVNDMNHIDAVATGYRLNTPINNEYFLLENRQKTGWDTYIKGEGLGIYHINLATGSNANENQPLVLLEQADGQQHLQNKNNNGDAGDLFPGSSNNQAFGEHSNPNSKNYNASSSGVNIYGINMQGDLINFSYGSAVACDGTPSPGNTTTTESMPPVGHEFTLAMSSPPTENGIEFQWQSSSNNSTWQNDGGANGSTHVSSVSNETWFRCQVTCNNSGNSANTNPIKITPTICTAGANSNQYEKISHINFGSINNSSSSTGGYEDFTDISTTLFQGNSYEITTTIENPYTNDQVIVWIDLNQDNDFEDSGERVYISNLGTGPHTGNINIPGSSSIGETRMRVRLHDAGNGPLAEPCGNSTYGQVEDYTLIIVAPGGGGCDEHMSLESPTDDIHIGMHQYTASNAIVASSEITGGHVTFDAGQSTTLMPNFSINQGAELLIMTEGCSSTSSPLSTSSPE